MKQYSTQKEFDTRGRGLINVTSPIVSWVREQGVQTGLLTVFVRHTSASLLIQENADSDVLRDMEGFFKRLVKDGDPAYYHVMEGPDDMSAHIRTALTQTQLTIPVVSGAPGLGIWQGIYLYEHRTHPHRRTLLFHLLGE